MSSGIYKIENIINGNCYIGSAKDLLGRKAQHFHKLRHNTHISKHMQHAFNKYGEDNFKFSVILNCDPSELIKYEQFYIDELKPEYNIRKVAQSNLGIKMPEDVVKRLANLRRGKKRTEEFCEKMRAIKTGYKFSDESKTKMSQARKKWHATHDQSGENNPMYGKRSTRLGVPRSDDVKQKISASLKKHFASIDRRSED